MYACKRMHTRFLIWDDFAGYMRIHINPRFPDGQDRVSQTDYTAGV